MLIFSGAFGLSAPPTRRVLVRAMLCRTAVVYVTLLIDAVVVVTGMITTLFQSAECVFSCLAFAMAFIRPEILLNVYVFL